MAAKELRDIRKEMFAEMEQRLNVIERQKTASSTIIPVRIESSSLMPCFG